MCVVFHDDLFGDSLRGRPGNYLEDTVFPTLAFPSDHGILSMNARLLP